MISICSYCGKDQGDVAPFDKIELTHGICEHCRKTAEAFPKWSGIGVVALREKTREIMATRRISK